MGDDDDGLVVLLHVADNVEKTLRLLRGQNGGRLIKDQDVRTAVENLDDLQGLLLGHAHLIDLLVRIQVKMVAVADLLCLSAHLFEVKFLALFQTEGDIFQCRKNVDQFEMLVDHTDAQIKGVFGRTDLHRFPIHQDLACIRIVDAGQHVHQGCFAAAVLTQQ